MDKFIIHGGKSLKGEVKISGAKNSALPIMASSLLCPGVHKFHNIPRLKDISTMIKLLSHLGAVCEEDNTALTISSDNIRADDAPYDVVKTMRASVLVMGPLVGRFGHARVSLPGGCAIGARPIDLHLKALVQMGAEITLHEGLVEIKAPRLHGAEIVFDKITVTGTENIMMAAAKAQGTTTLENAAQEPEVADLAAYLNKMGAKIEGAGTSKIIIEGVKSLAPSSHSIISDRIEAATFMIASAATGGDITITNAPCDFLETIIAHLKEANASISKTPGGLKVTGPKRPSAVDMTTAPYPGFATDVQAQFMALMTIADGTSVITEEVFENRFMHVAELNRLGASITIEGPTAVVRGRKKLLGAPVLATDLRASASLVIAALAAEGITEIKRIYHLDRGYERLEEKLTTLGAKIDRIQDHTV